LALAIRRPGRDALPLLIPLAFNHIGGDGYGFSDAFSLRGGRRTLLREIP
jgi:hypothetical protein